MVKLMTFSGRIVDLKEPAASAIDPEDIARGLAHAARWGGQTAQFYSVAQHSYLVASLAPRGLKLAALLHDASEAYTGDLPRPVKRNIGRRAHELERRLMGAVAARFRLSPSVFQHAALAVLDDRVALAEARDLTDWFRFGSQAAWCDALAFPPQERVRGLEPARLFVTPWSVEFARRAFSEALAALSGPPGEDAVLLAEGGVA